MLSPRIRTVLKGPRAAAADERGATIVEFALIAPVFLMFLIGLIDFGRLFWTKNTMQYVVEQTARYAMVNPDATTTALETYASQQVDGLLSNITFSITTETISNVEFRAITANYSFDYLIPLVSLNDIPLSTKSRTPVKETS